ncbi:arginine--tRNA ligase [Candidatus Sumerlaeota bacterium]|nr:arginine--tRNA ligase [Candidatus Sumerlaeota bacterium]
METKTALQELLHQALISAFNGVDGLPETKDIAIKPASKAEFGDFSNTSAMGLASTLRQPPIKIAQTVVAEVEKMGCPKWIKRMDVVSPGFINIWLAGDSAFGAVKAIIEQGENYGRKPAGTGRRTLVEFVSANPTGPLHVGHGRGAVVGDCICRILEANGCEVTREYYYNNAGVQMKNLGRSLHARYLQALGDDVEFPDDGYKGDYVRELAETLKEEAGESKRDAKLEFFTVYASDRIMQWIDEDLKAMGITFDVFFKESSLYESGEVEEALKQLAEREMSYKQDGALWLKSTQFGDEKDRVLIKSDGEKTYLTPDIAYHLDKARRGFERAINILGHDHHGYIVRLKAGIQALGFSADFLDCPTIQMVSVERDGKEVKLSTRGGEFITLKELLDEFGADVVRYFMAMRSYDSQFTFDLNLAQDTSEKNPLYKIQYAHARTCNLLVKAKEQGIEWQGADAVDFELLQLSEEKELGKALARYPEIVDRAAAELAPHCLPNYLLELANLFNSYFAVGNNDASARILRVDAPELTQARLALVVVLRQVLRNALGLLGISAPERM